MQRTETLIFDVGQVLYRWDLRFLFAKLIDDPDELEWFVTTVVTPEWHFQHDEGRALDAMLPELIARFPEQAERIEAYRHRFNETIPGPMPGMAELMEDIRATGLPLFAITNFGDEFWQRFHPTARLLDGFADIIVSGTEKLAKPDPSIFHLARERFGIDPATALFIDDRADNVAAAQSVGFAGHHFSHADNLRADLVARGILTGETDWRRA